MEKNGQNHNQGGIPTHILNINAYMLILINKLTEISKIPDFLENSGKMLIPDLFRNQWEVHQNGQSYKHTEFQDDRPYSSRETEGVDSTPPPDSFIAQNIWTGDRVNTL